MEQFLLKDFFTQFYFFEDMEGFKSRFPFLVLNHNNQNNEMNFEEM